MQELNKLGELFGAKGENGSSAFGELRDLCGDLRSNRFLHFYSIPKVKFALHFAAHLLYLLLLTHALLMNSEGGTGPRDINTAFASWMRHSGQLGPISSEEYFFFFWTISTPRLNPRAAAVALAHTSSVAPLNTRAAAFSCLPSHGLGWRIPAAAAAVFGELNEVKTHWQSTGSFTSAIALYLNNFWNAIDVLLCVLVSVVCVLRHLCETGHCDHYDFPPAFDLHALCRNLCTSAASPTAL